MRCLGLLETAAVGRVPPPRQCHHQSTAIPPQPASLPEIQALKSSLFDHYLSIATSLRF